MLGKSPANDRCVLGTGRGGRDYLPVHRSEAKGHADQDTEGNAAMTTFAAFTAAIRSAWTRLAGRAATAETMAGLGPNLRKEAGLASETGARFSV
jgi:hypothetical protein